MSSRSVKGLSHLSFICYSRQDVDECQYIRLSCARAHDATGTNLDEGRFAAFCRAQQENANLLPAGTEPSLVSADAVLSRDAMAATPHRSTRFEVFRSCRILESIWALRFLAAVSSTSIHPQQQSIVPSPGF